MTSPLSTLSIILLLIVTINAVNYKYVDLALKKCPGQSRWSIHGFWPQYNKHSYPQWCDKNRYKQFNTSIIEPIRSILNDDWGVCQSWKGTSDVDFWKHEWEKHGTCTNDTVVNFFTQSLQTFMIAHANNWYGCCDKNISSIKTNIDMDYSQCLIPFSKNETKIKWLGWCKT